MKEITINEKQLSDLESIIWFSERMVKAHHLNEQRSDDIDRKHIFKQLAAQEEYKLTMAYDILRALGLSYDPDTGRITKKEEA